MPELLPLPLDVRAELRKEARKILYPSVMAGYSGDFYS